jgi:hypothetical protein
LPDAGTEAKGQFPAVALAGAFRPPTAGQGERIAAALGVDANPHAAVQGFAHRKGTVSRIEHEVEVALRHGLASSRHERPSYDHRC